MAGQVIITGSDRSNAAVALLAGSSASGNAPGHVLYDVNGVLISSGNPLAVTGPFTLADGLAPSQKATVAVFHAADNQTPGGTAYGLLTGGVAQLLNPVGAIDRQRETGFDNISAAGIATGTQQLAGPLLATTVSSGAITLNASAQNVTLTTATFTNRGVVSTYQSGTTVLVDSGLAAQEYVFLNTVNAGTGVVNGIFLKNHLANATVSAFSFNQARDATIPDGSPPAGINAGAAYLFNAGNNTVQFERSFAGELMGATGTGAAVAVEYEDTGGGPPLLSGVSSNFRLLPAQSLLGITLATAAITSTTAGLTGITFGSAAATNMIPAGHAIQLSGGAVVETVFVSPTWTPGSAALVPLISPVVNLGQVLAAWSTFAPNGPGLSGFLAHGLGIEEEAVYDPVTAKFYLERSATQDGVAPQNVVLESPALWNGSTMDRAKGAAAAGNGIGVQRVQSEGGMLSTLNVSVGTVIKAAAGRAFKLLVNTAGSTAGTVSDVTTTGAVAAANLIFSIPNTVGAYDLNWPCAAGIVIVPGTAQVVSISYT